MRAKELAGIVTQQSVLSLDGLLSQVPGTGSVNTGSYTTSSFTLHHTFKKRLGALQGQYFFGCTFDMPDGSWASVMVCFWKHVRCYILDNWQVVTAQTF